MTSFTSRQIITSQTIGERLAKTRHGCGASLCTVARQIGVKENYLVAIETGRYNELPGDIYTLEFIKAYARYLRLDEGEVMREYLAERLAPNVIKVKKISEQSLHLWLEWLKGRRAGLAKYLATAAGLVLLAMTINLARSAFLPPQLEVFSPTAYYETTGSLVVLSGQTEPRVEIFVNNEPIFIDERGAFNETINMAAGVSLFKIVARDSQGREQVAWRTVRIGGQVAGASTTKEKF